MPYQKTGQKTGPKPTNERIAHIVAEYHFLGATATAKRWEISTRTIERYRVIVNKDTKLQQLVTQKKKEMAEKWIDSAGEFLNSAIAKLQELVDMADSTDHIHAVTGSIKVIGELKLGASVLYDPSSEQVAKPEEATAENQG